MGHIPGAKHIRPEELDRKMSTLPKDKEIIVVDMFGSQGLAPAVVLKEAGYKVGYLANGMMDWHIARGYETAY
jgi:rhodanese-related sulfurtransferase